MMPNMLLEFESGAGNRFKISEYGAGEYSAYFTPVFMFCFPINYLD